MCSSAVARAQVAAATRSARCQERRRTPAPCCCHQMLDLHSDIAQRLQLQVQLQQVGRPLLMQAALCPAHDRWLLSRDRPRGQAARRPRRGSSSAGRCGAPDPPWAEAEKNVASRAGAGGAEQQQHAMTAAAGGVGPCAPCAWVPNSRRAPSGRGMLGADCGGKGASKSNGSISMQRPWRRSQPPAWRCLRLVLHPSEPDQRQKPAASMLATPAAHAGCVCQGPACGCRGCCLLCLRLQDAVLCPLTGHYFPGSSCVAACGRWMYRRRPARVRVAGNNRASIAIQQTMSQPAPAPRCIREHRRWPQRCRPRVTAAPGEFMRQHRAAGGRVAAWSGDAARDGAATACRMPSTAVQRISPKKSR
jgi:hypothetical protein